jgi:hypothetical protein
MQLSHSQSSQRPVRYIVYCGLAALTCSAYAQSYYGANYQPHKAKPLAGKMGGTGHGQAHYMHPTRDLYNKYFYHSPGVSPYQNLDRPRTGGSTAYHAYVLPEQQRRQREAQQQSAYIAARKRETSYHGMNYGTPVKSVVPAASKVRPNAYYNQWYGGKQYR